MQQTHCFWTLVQALLVLFGFTYTRSMAFVIGGGTKQGGAIYTCKACVAATPVRIELWFFHNVVTTFTSVRVMVRH